MKRTVSCLFVLQLALVIGPIAAHAQNPIVVALMTGLNPGANPGMAILNGKLQAEFGGGGPLPPFSSQVFAYTNQSGASTFLLAPGPSARRVLIGHSWGASSNFTLAQNLGMSVDLQISIDWVSQSTPFSATTPTVPSAILLAYNYHQTSTQFLEPVPSATIIGAARNLNMETVFADTTLVHTSVDDDDRVHQLVIERIRELIAPHPFPGTGEHLDLFCRRDTLNVACTPGAGISVAGVLSERAVQTVQAGQWITLRTLSPEGDLANTAFGILGEIFTTGSPPISAMPGIASSLNQSALIMVNPSGVQMPPTYLVPLPAAGWDFSVCWPAGFAGTSVLLQTVVLSPSTQNAWYATSFGIELRGI